MKMHFRVTRPVGDEWCHMPQCHPFKPPLELSKALAKRHWRMTGNRMYVTCWHCLRILKRSYKGGNEP